MKILITGSGGQLGKSLLMAMPKDFEVFAFDSSTLNITDEQQVVEQVLTVKPDYIVNAAAYTAVDDAESDYEKAHAVNVSGTAYIAKAAQQVGAKFIHVSTDYVFDGLSVRPYNESDNTGPQSVYGQTKLEGEQVALAACNHTIILRTSWVFSEYGHNFLKTMLRLFVARDALSVVSDQYGKPTYAGHIANAIVQIIKMNIQPGVYHFAGDKTVSWFEFAQFILAEFNLLNDKKVQISQIPSSDYPQKAKRPMYSVLDTSKIESAGITVSDWQSAVKQVVNHLNG